MPHCDEEVLALIALGEPAAGPADEAHLNSCARCQSELDQLKAVVHASRQVTSDDRPSEPGPEVWERIAAELDVEPPRRQLGLDPAPRREVRRTTRRTAMVAAAAVFVGLLIGIAGTAYLKNQQAPAVSGGVVVAHTALAPLDAPSAHGTATVRVDAGVRTITVDVQGLSAPDDAFYQVWLADRQTKRMVAVGVLDKVDQGTFAVPPGLSLSIYPIVDVSLEPMDGNPAHSTVSVVRGMLPG